MNRHNFNQNPANASAVQQVNSVANQQMCNGNVGGLIPNNRPIVAPPCFMNLPNQPFPFQNAMGQFPNGIGGFSPHQNLNIFPVNQFNLSQQQHGQFIANSSMNPTVYNQNVGLPSEQVIVQNTIQNICQLLQLQNPGHAQFSGNYPMFQNQIANVMTHQSQGFFVNQQFGMSNPNGQHANQGSPFLPHASGSVQTQQAQNLLATQTNFQNQIANNVGPQNPSFPANQQFGMANSNGPVQHVNQGQQRFGSQMMDANALKQIPNMGNQGSSSLPHASPSLTNFKDNHGNMSANVSTGWAESQRKNFTGHKKNDASHKGFKSPSRHAKHMKEKFGVYNGNINQEGNSNAAVSSGSQISSKSEKKVPSLKYTDQEIKQWREARRRHFPTSENVEKKRKKDQTSADATNQEATLHRQQLKEILTKQAELGCEVADIPSSYFSGHEKQNPRGKRHEKGQFKKGKSHNKRGKRPRLADQDSVKTSYRAYESKPKVREPSLLQKLLTRDIKRDKNHLLQVFRFIAINSFFTAEPDEGLRFPSVILRETNPDVAEEITREGLVEEEEGEIID